MEEEGVKVLFYTQNKEEVLEDEEKVQEVLVTEIPRKYHNSPEVLAAKEVEMSNFHKFQAYEEVEDVGQERITSRWVVTLKEAHDGMKQKVKARLVVRGFQEETTPRADSPTLAKESFKTMIAIAANEGFRITSMDITNAYLQGSPIDREVIVEPPSDQKKPGILWRLKKTVYGTADGARKFYISVNGTLQELGCIQVSGEEALYYWHDKNGKLAGLIGIHVDDFFVAGSEEFHQAVGEELKKRYVFGKIEDVTFRFTGMDVKQTEEGIEVSQRAYCEALEEMKIPDKKNTERELTKDEYKKFRGAVGKLNWLQEATRPDLSFDNLNMSMKTKNATVADVNKLNKVIKKAKEGAEESAIRYKHIDSFENLKIFGYADASYKTMDDKVRSVEGRVIFLTNGERASPLLWKSKKIARVCDSTKTAETLAMDKTCDDAIYLSRMIREIYTGQKSLKGIPVEMFTDSKPLFESLNSTKQVDRKTVRHVICMMKDSVARGEVEKINWISTKFQLADILTKESVNSDELMKVLEHGRLEKRHQGGEECDPSHASNIGSRTVYKPCNDIDLHLV